MNTAYEASMNCITENALTPRQIEVLDLFVRGKAIKQIAHDLHISPWTVYSHLYSARKLMGAVSLPHMVFIATSSGLISKDVEDA